MTDPSQQTSITRDDVIKMVNSAIEQMRSISQKQDQSNQLLLGIRGELELLKQQTHLRLIALEESNKVSAAKEKEIADRVKQVEKEIVVGQTYATIFKWCATAFLGFVVTGVWTVGKTVWEVSSIKEKVDIISKDGAK